MKYIGLISSDARGKNGGNVASRNRFGTYLRRHVSPVQPRSSSQLNNRQVFGYISSQWRGLTATQQAGWNTLATTVTFKNSMGASYNPTGAQLYMLMSRYLYFMASSPLATAPTALPSIPALTAIGPTVQYGYSTASVALTGGGTGYPSTGTFTVTWTTGTQASGTYTASAGVIQSPLTLTVFGTGQTGTAVVAFSGGGTGATATATLSTTPNPRVTCTFAPTPVPSTNYLFWYGSKALSVGTTFTSRGQFRFLQASDNGVSSAVDLHVAANTAFGLLPSHGRMRFKALFVDIATGYPGPDLVADTEW